MSEQPAAGWYRDPTERFDHRYWDGGTWTEHVSRNGQATTDPLDGGTAPADTAVIPATSPSGEQDEQPGHTGGAQPWETSGGAAAPWRDQATSSASWQDQATAAARTNTKAIASLVLSIIWLGGLASIPAVILGIMAKREIRERPGEGGGGVATAGIIIGVIGVVGAVLILIAILSFVAMGSSDSMFMGLG